MNQCKKKIICGAAAILLACTAFVSCGNESGSGDAPKKERQRKPATPSIGIGRIMPEVHEPKAFTVLIDPGHGFEDGGAGDGILPDGYLEKDVNLAIANYLKEDLTEYGFQIIMSHDGVTFPQSVNYDNNNKFNPNERVAYANQQNIDYYISIHVNSHTDPNASGARVYYQQTWVKENQNSEAITRYVANSIDDAFTGDVDVVVHNDVSLAVTRETKAAATLVEVGFCTNPTDAANMIQPEWQAQMAQAMADGIHQYYTENVEIPS